MESMVPRPPVVLWYKAYCALLALTYLATVAFGVFLILARDSMADAENAPEAFIVGGVICGGIGLVCAVPCVAALFLPPRPWTWIYHLVIICVGLTSACCIPICVPLLIFWFKPETKEYFGRPA